jgi:hypothetical protein
MPYPTLPDRAIPYHLDGTVVKYVRTSSGVMDTLSDAEMADLNDFDEYDEVGNGFDPDDGYVVFFFPEKRVITGLFALFSRDSNQYRGPASIEGSNDTTNGVDGTWTSISPASSFNGSVSAFDSWRDEIADLSNSTGYEVYRVVSNASNYGGVRTVHLYGVKDTGETADDILFLDADDSDNEFTEPLDFGAVGAGSSEEHNIKIKNDSGSLTASSITITVTDANDYIRISEDGGSTWVTEITIASLGPGVKSSTIKVKSEPSAPPTPLEPVRASISVDVGGWA